MKPAIDYTANLSVLGGQDVASTTTASSRELSLDELAWVGGGQGVGGTK
jgi:hypothetical protein